MPVVEKGEVVVGVITAGDLTRYADGHDDFLAHRVERAMNPSPRTTGPDALATQALHRMQEHGIMAMPVVDDEGILLGMVHLHDLLAARIS